MTVETVTPITVTASVPGISATTTATPDHVEWDPGDGSTVICPDMGARWIAGGPDAPACGWTPKVPSAPKFTHTDDLKYHGVFRIVWKITWQATDGSGGNLGYGTSRTATRYEVDEIQTIGDG